MIELLGNAMEQDGKTLEDLSLIVPHQANQRIINAVRQRLKIREEQIYSEIRYRGNTSSCTIPLCLETLVNEKESGDILGLTAFGGGFYFGGWAAGNPLERQESHHFPVGMMASFALYFL